MSDVKPLERGDLVIPKDPHDVLHCGSGVYPYAFVVSVDPFVLISESGDMVWSCRDRAGLRAPRVSLAQVKRRGLDELWAQAGEAVAK